MSEYWKDFLVKQRQKKKEKEEVDVHGVTGNRFSSLQH